LNLFNVEIMIKFVSNQLVDFNMYFNYSTLVKSCRLMLFFLLLSGINPFIFGDISGDSTNVESEQSE